MSNFSEFLWVCFTADVIEKGRKRMKNMKKILLIALVVVFASLGLVGCGSSDKTYVIATDTTFAPFEFTDSDNEFVGIDVDILDAIAKDQGFEYDLQSLGFDAAIAAVESGQADGVIAGMSITEERQKTYDFSEAYFDSTVCAAVKADSDAKALDDIKGEKVAVKTGTQSAAWAESIKDKYELELKYFDDSAMMYQAVTSGKTAACFEDYPVMAYGITQDNGMKLLVEEKGDYATPYGFAVKKDENADLLKMFNDGLKNIKDNGTYDEIINKYTESK